MTLPLSYSRLLVALAALFFQPFVPRPRSQCKHGENCQGRNLELWIAQRRPSQHCQHCVHAQSHVKLIHEPKFWCTGEDSNLRSSQGAADLQSAAINHSATCAHSTTPISANAALLGGPSSTEPSPFAESRSAAPGTPVLPVKERRQTHPAKFRNSRAIKLPRVLQALAATGISSLGELRVSFGLLLLPAAAGGALTVTIWSWRRDLNPRPSDYKSDALPAELRQPAWFDTSVPDQAQFFAPAGTIIERTTTAIRVQANGWNSNNFRKHKEPATRHSHRQIGWDSAERVRDLRTQNAANSF